MNPVILSPVRQLPALSSALKLYRFNPASYGSQWAVVAASREAAVAAVKEHERLHGHYSHDAHHGSLGTRDGTPFYGTYVEREKRRVEGLAHLMADIDLYAQRDVECQRDTVTDADEWDSLTEHPLDTVVATEIC